MAHRAAPATSHETLGAAFEELLEAHLRDALAAQRRGARRRAAHRLKALDELSTMVPRAGAPHEYVSERSRRENNQPRDSNLPLVH